MKKRKKIIVETEIFCATKTSLVGAEGMLETHYADTVTHLQQQPTVIKQVYLIYENYLRTEAPPTRQFRALS